MTPEQYIEYEQDMREAQVAFPDERNMRAAYERFMVEVKKKPPRPKLSSNDPVLKAATAAIHKAFRRPCDQSGCKGEQVLQGVCEGCAAGKKGFKSLWECEECLHREYSKRPYLDWYNELKEVQK